MYFFSFLLQTLLHDYWPMRSKQSDGIMCDECKMLTFHDETYRLEDEKLPDVLTINLIRYKFDRTTNRAQKIRVAVDPDTVIQLPSRLFNKISDISATYQLKSFCVHTGETTNTGHYYTINVEGQGVYVCCDDEKINTIAKIQSHTKAGIYLLTYEKIDLIDNRFDGTVIPVYHTLEIFRKRTKAFDYIINVYSNIKIDKHQLKWREDLLNGLKKHKFVDAGIIQEVRMALGYRTHEQIDSVTMFNEITQFFKYTVCGPALEYQIYIFFDCGKAEILNYEWLPYNFKYDISLSIEKLVDLHKDKHECNVNRRCSVVEHAINYLPSTLRLYTSKTRQLAIDKIPKILEVQNDSILHQADQYKYRLAFIFTKTYQQYFLDRDGRWIVMNAKEKTRSGNVITDNEITLESPMFLYNREENEDSGTDMENLKEFDNGSVKGELTFETSKDDVHLRENVFEKYGMKCTSESSFKMAIEIMNSDYQWLSSICIDLYVNYLKAKSDKSVFNLPAGWFNQHQFLNGAPKKQIENLLELKSDKLFAHEFIVIPININSNHWVLCMADVQKRILYYGDSMKQQRFSLIKNVMRFFESQHFYEMGKRLKVCEWSIIEYHNQERYPTQKDGHSCGFYVLMMIKAILFNLKFRFNSKNVRKTVRIELYSNEVYKNVV